MQVMDDDKLLLSAAFVRKGRFSTSDLAGTPRPVIILRVEGDALVVLEQGYLRCEIVRQARDVFFYDAVPDLTRTRYQAAVAIHKVITSWLGSSEAARLELAVILKEGEKVMKKTKPVKPVKVANLPVAVWADAQRRTCISAERAPDAEAIRFIPMEVGDGFDVESLPAPEFAKQYKLLGEYPAERAAQLYVSYAVSAGATEAAMSMLSGIIKVTPKEIEMATSKKAATAAKKATKPAAKAAAKGKAPAKGKAAKGTNGAAPAKTPRGETAASMFQALIREGKLTDGDIFAKVQSKFGLDDKKRSYVAWYRNYLTKKGEKVPGPVGAGA